MQADVDRAIRDGIKKRREVLVNLTHGQRQALLGELFIDLFGHQHVTLQKWAALTGQSAQVDTGYIAQFVASIVLGEPGQGFRGKGDDLADGSEVKGAANISGVDRPRWNHNVGTIAEDAQRRAKGQMTKSEEYLASPYLFYLLVDRVAKPGASAPIRLRGWCVNAQEDTAWRDFFHKFVAERGPVQYNLQLHPPVGYDDDIVVNTLGNLDFADILVFDARVLLDDRLNPTVRWEKPLPEVVLPISGRTKAIAYGLTPRPTRLTHAGDLVADIQVIPGLFPGILSDREQDAVEEATYDEVKLDLD